MASIVEKKFNWFEQHLRENLKEHTLASPLYEGIPEGETDIFMVFYLKILLDKLDKDKANSLLDVPDTDRAEPRFGYRTAVPVPKGGIAAIKVGNVPKFDIDEFIGSTIQKAIQDYLRSAAISSDLTRELGSNTNLQTISRDDLKMLSIPSRKYSKQLRNFFHLEDYLNEQNHKFISKEIIKNIKQLHKCCVFNADFNPNTSKPFRNIFPDVQDNPNTVYVNPEEWISVRTGVIPLGTIPDLPDSPANLLDLFRQGNAAQFTVQSFEVEPLTEFSTRIKTLYDDFHDKLDDDKTRDPSLFQDEMDAFIEESNAVSSYFYDTIKNIPYVNSIFINTEGSLGLDISWLVDYTTYMTDYLKGMSNREALYDIVHSELSQDGVSLYLAYKSFADFLVYDDEGNIVINVIYPEPEEPSSATSQSTSSEAEPVVNNTSEEVEPIVDDRPAILSKFKILEERIKATYPIIQDGEVSTQWAEWKEKFGLMYTSTDTIQSKEDITPAKVKTFINACNAFFNLDYSAYKTCTEGLVERLDNINDRAGDLSVTVDANFLSRKVDGRNIFGHPFYTIIPYKGTIICYYSGYPD